MPFHFFEDFKVKDEQNRSYRVAIEESTALSCAHASVNETGRYHITLNGNKHILKTPVIRNFILSMDYELTCLNKEFGYGLVFYFRYDRITHKGHCLECRWDKNDIFHVMLDDCEIYQDNKNGEMTGRISKAVLSVTERHGIIEIADRKIEFDILEDESPGRGQVAFDSCFCPGGTLYADAVSLTSDDQLKRFRIGKKINFTLACVQGMTEALKYELEFFRYDTGEVELEYTIGGTIKSRGDRIETGGGEWTYEVDEITDPYIRLESGASEIENLYIWRNTKCIFDPDSSDTKMHLFPQPEWPLKNSLVFFDFPEKFTAAAGYAHMQHTPWCFSENGPYEMIRDQDNNLIYEGDSIRRNLVTVIVKSLPDKRIVSMIPPGIPEYSRAIEHAGNEHYFFESETVAFSFEIWFSSNAYDINEFETDVIFADAYGEPLTNIEFELTDPVTTEIEGGFSVVHRAIHLTRTPSCGVWQFRVKVRTGKKVRCDSTTVFEVFSDNPEGECPPLASGLPEMIPMPNETKWLESDGFDPLGGWSGFGHYFSGCCRYPAVGRKLKIWELLKLYRRKWMLMLTPRNTGDTDIDSPVNDELIKHADYVDAQDSFFTGRYDLYSASFYRNGQLKLLKKFISEKNPPLRRLNLSGIEKMESGNSCMSPELFRDLAENAWQEWCVYFAENIQPELKKFVDRLLEKNPKAGRASYGPVPVYASHYKSAYTLKYSGYRIEDDERLRINGSFWFLEEYHYSCDYQVSAAAFFVATYKLMYPYGRKIYPEIYYHSHFGCNDGAVFQAHPPFGIYRVPHKHYKRLIYQFTYGTAQFRDGMFCYWRDYGFQTRNPDKGSMENMIYAWGKMIHNKPASPLKAPFLMTDPAQLDRHGDYQETEYSFRIKGHGCNEDFCNTAEEALAWSHEMLSRNGYNSPVVTFLAELDSITPEMAQFIVLPPVVEGTPHKYIDAIRRAHQRGINLIGFEAVCGLEDLFGVSERLDGGIKINKAGNEVFNHKKAVAYYDTCDAETILTGGENGKISLVMTKKTPYGKTAFFNLPPTVVKRESFRERYGHGQRSMSHEMGSAFKNICRLLAGESAISVERGAVFASRTEDNAIVVILSEDSPVYGDTTPYPISFRFTIREPGIGKMKIESDAEYSIVHQENDLITLRTETAKDDALFFRFSMDV